MVDPYIQDNKVLINKLGITDEKELEELEKDITDCEIDAILSFDISNHTMDYDFFKGIHKFLFKEIYHWAGEERTISMSKSEDLLDGKSLKYEHHDRIESNIQYDIKELNETDWHNLSDEKKIDKFTKIILRIWEVHPFRDGNTRTTMVFISLFSKKHGFPINLTKRENIRNRFLEAVDSKNRENLKKFFLEALESSD